MNQDKLQMFVERYLELSSELKYRKGEAGAFLQLGELLTQKGDFNTGTSHFYRAMKLAEETQDNNTKETAKVNFGMANASMKWNEHVGDILKQVQTNQAQLERHEEEDDLAERGVEEEEDDQ